MSEIWRDIKGYEGLYYISDKGRVYSTKARNGKGDIMKCRISDGGYRTICLTKDGIKSTKHIARTVLETFVGCSSGIDQAVHKDGDKLNDCLENLEWGKPNRKKVPYKFPHETDEFMTLGEFKERYGLSDSTLGNILGIHQGIVTKYLAGEYQFARKTIDRLAKLGIDVSNKRSVAKEVVEKHSKKVLPKKKKPKKDEIIKDFQLAAMARFGNTIVSKKYSIDTIKAEFKKRGYSVKVREFGPCPISDMQNKNSHYVVTQVGRGELYDK